MSKDLVPIVVLTGFLGSGKTTLLNYLLKQSEMSNTLVIINEFGDIGLDHMLVAHSVDHQEVVEISAGCICCNLRSDLKKTLKEIGWRFSRGGKKFFDRVLIETTGLADPAPVLHTIMTDAYMTAHYRLDGVVTTVDAVNGMQTLSTHYEAIKQLAIADAVLLTKTDLVSDTERSNIEARILAINPAAKRYEVQHGALACEKLLNLSLLQKLLTKTLTDNQAYADQIHHWLRHDYYLNFSHSVQHLSEHAHHHDDIAAFYFNIEPPVTQLAFQRFLALLKDIPGQDLLRIKGIFNFQDCEKPMVFHAVQHIFHPLVALPEWPLSKDHHQKKVTQLVFITHDMTKETLDTLIGRAFASTHTVNTPASLKVA